MRKLDNLRNCQLSFYPEVGSEVEEGGGGRRLTDADILPPAPPERDAVDYVDNTMAPLGPLLPHLSLVA
ncbi:hypothetical protein J6590_043102 [Homalodisca vitripennis]|nr:hypothetical protein J6590_043102 [Homalodisca vitripennis]